MLRGLVVGVGLAALVAAALAARQGCGEAALWLAVIGLACSGGVAWERWRYRALDAAPPGPGWQRTGERFVDPASGRLTEV